ncbi:Amidohydro-rel domain-containing protein [Trichoderma simmonsii]|uniref:6-methylsalicylate decarboxylase n=1 Tax=Trichoderma simmonsii TaxID=1491479 RepID=A0A8G0L0U9_9HYPO|nr:Amidohydro-rel domain-containing protein [Trichoderma simmonsii]
MDKVDVHHHFIGPDFLEAWNTTAVSKRVKLPPWTPELSLAFMDNNGISQAVLSPALPPSFVCPDTTASAQLARKMNEYAASICRQNPSRFVFVATLPDPRDSEQAIAELAHACDNLGACGVSLFTSYDGRYLGDPVFAPLWAELDRRAAVVLVHPGMDFADQLITSPSLLPRPVVDWTHETTRTATHLILSDTLRRHQHCKVILPHGGGTLPYVVGRLASLASALGLAGGTKSADDVQLEARRFYYDVAFAAFDEPLELLRRFAAPGHLLYGSDFPYGRDKEFYGAQIRTVEAITGEEREEMLHRAARRIFPSLGKDNGIISP